MIKVDANLNKPINMMQALARLDGLKRGLHAAGVVLQGEMMEYPPQPSGVSYKRKGMSGGLKSKWSTKTRKRGLEVVVGNNAPYANQVQGVQTIPYFRKVWGKHSVSVVGKRMEPRLTSIVTNEINRSL